MLKINIKIYLKIAHIFSSAMWPLPREIFDLAIGSLNKVQFSSVQSLSRVWLCNSIDCSTPGLSVHHHLILCHPLLLLLSIFPSIRVFSKESVLCIRHRGWLQRGKLLNEKLISNWEINNKDTFKTPCILRLDIHF